MNYVYPEIITVSADIVDYTVRKITFFEVDEEDVRTILKIADFPKEQVIEDDLSFEGGIK